MSNTRERYVAVNGAWPTGSLPPLTAGEAVRAFRMLYHHRFHERWPHKVKAVKGANRRTHIDWIGRRQNVKAMLVAPDAGWHSFIHDLSHWMHRRQYPHQNPHKGSAHPAVEIDLIEKVVNSGWLDGRLKRPEKPKKERNVRAERGQRVLENLARWERKKKRAETAIKKLKRQAKYYERVAA